MTRPAPTLAALVRASCAAHADRPALRTRRGTETYAAMWAAADAVAGHLRRHGIGRGARVAVWQEKSPAAVHAILGTLLAGAAYVPLDPRAPARRIRRILEDCGPAAIAVDALRRRLLPEVTGGSPVPLTIEGDAAPADDAGGGHAGAGARSDARAGVGPDTAPGWPDVGAEDPAYVLYTSGSTGQPKGVELSHGAAMAFVDWCRATFAPTPEDRVASHAPLHFDLSIFDLFVTIAAGASARLIDGTEAMLAPWLVRMVAESRLTIWYSVPSALVDMLERGGLAGRAWPDLRLVLFAGEVFPLPHLRRLRAALPTARLVNLYGPTESNVCTWHEVGARAPDESASLPLGRPCGHATVALLDDDGREVAPGREGEIHVGGPSLLTRYWNDPALTAARLRPDPRPGRSGLLFRTGDRASIDEAGHLLFLGRRDDMVKVRGHRVALGEIEAALHEHPDVEAAAVLAIPRDGGPTWIAAWVQPRVGATMGVPGLRTHLAERLPRHMLPERLRVIEALPRTSTGKIDRTALRAAADDRP